MNNGVNNTNTNNPNTLAPMAGVKIAPAQEGPVNAHHDATAPAHAVPQPTITKTIPVTATPPQPQPTVPPQPQQPVPQPQQPTTPPPQPPAEKEEKVVKETAPKKGISLAPILLFVIAILGILLFYNNNSNKQQLTQLKYNCTPVSSTNEEKELKLDSTIVQTLYSRVQTSIREDLAQPEFNDEMKLYLAYRQIIESDKFESNCNGFEANKMEPYKCEQTNTWAPKAFKADTLRRKLKELYGENTLIPLKNIQLGNTCIVGYQYIEARDEFVEGTCNQKTATSFKVNKSLSKAVTTRNTIILTEEVKYIENEGMNLPSYLKSGTYKYVFRLDLNYNYVLVSKTFESKY